MLPPYECTTTDLFRCDNHKRMDAAYAKTGLTARVIHEVSLYEHQCSFHEVVAVRCSLINAMLRHRQAAIYYKGDLERRSFHVSEALRIRSVLCVGKVFYASVPGDDQYIPRTCPGFMSIQKEIACPT